MQRFGNILLTAPGSVITVMILLIFLAIYPASRITTDFNLEGFYPKKDKVIEDYQLLEDEFGRDDNTIIIGLSAKTIFTAQILNDIKELTSQFEQIEFIESVRSITNAEQIKNNHDQLEFSPYINQIPGTKEELEEIKGQITDDPFLSGLLINHEGTATSLILSIREKDNTYTNRNLIIESINDSIEEYTSQYHFYKSGIPYFRNQYVNLLNNEIIIYIALSSFLIILILWYLYRSIWGVLFPMIIVWTTLLFTVAIIQLTGGYLEIMSSTIAPILLCVGVADAIHMISKYDDARGNGFQKKESILEMLKSLGSATFLTSVTTAIGFASLLSSTVVPMARFGAYTAIGVLIAYVVTIFFLPAALYKSKKSSVFNEKSGLFYFLISKTLHRITAINRLHYKKILWTGIGGTLLITFGMKNVDVNGKVFDDLGDETELMQDSRFFSEHLAPQFHIELILDTGVPDGALNLDLMQRIEDLELFLTGFEEIHHVTGLNQLIKEVHHIYRDNVTNETERILPDTDSSISQYILLLEINDAPELSRMVDFDYSKLRVTAFTEDAGSKRINEIKDQIEEFLNDNSHEQVIITGTPILSADLTDKIVYSLAWSILIAVVAISLIMTILFQNTRMVIISLIPNLIPLLVIASVMGFLNIDIKPSTAVIFTIALGIAVDDSIHYLARFRIELMKTGAFNAALTATTVKTGRAIIVTSIVLIAGFGSLITSAFTSTATMGILVCTTIFAALISDLFILPALFYWLRPKLNIKKDSEFQ